MNWANKLQSIDRRIIYTLLLIGLTLPMIWPLNIPIAINETTRSIFSITERLNPATDVVLLSFDYSPASAPDIHPSSVAIVEHLTARGIRWVAVSFWPEGPEMVAPIMRSLEGRGYKYGEHFIDLGFKAGAENAIAAFAQNSRVITTDVRGNNIDNIRMMDNIKTMKDFAFVIGLSAGDPGYNAFIRQAVDPMGVNFAAAVVTVSVPAAMPFVASGQIKGLLQGLRGAAEYESLTKIPGPAAGMMDAQSVGHLIIVGFIIIGNVAYFFSKKK